MNDQLIRDLLHEVADDMEPADRLDAIRAATAPAGRRTRRGWWVAGGAGLVAASVVTALALTTGGAPRTTNPGPAGPPSTSGATATDGSTTNPPVAVYFVGDTAAGPRLHRELRSDLDESQVVFAIDATLRGDALDPDYRSAWPEGVVLRQWSSGPDGITVSLEGAPVERPEGMSELDARLALEQLVRTAQAVSGRGAVPVDVQVEQQVTDTILGVPTTAPMTGSPDLDVLAPVSLSEPAEGTVVDNDGMLRVNGRGVSANGNLNVTVDRVDGSASAGDGTLKGMLRPGRFSTFDMSFALAGAAPGDYVVVATVRNPDGTLDTDTRRVTVVD